MSSCGYYNQYAIEQSKLCNGMCQATTVHTLEKHTKQSQEHKLHCANKHLVHYTVNSLSYMLQRVCL